MKKGFKYYLISWIILFALINIIAFATPGEAAGFNKFGGSFWAGYIGIVLAFVGQLFCARLAINKSESKEQFFLNVPLITISYGALVTTIIFGGACMFFPNLPNWLGAIICLVILAFSAISVVKAKMAAEIVEDLDKNVKAQTFYIKALTADIDTLVSSAKSDEIKTDVTKVYEAVRYSDPMSNNALSGVESQITIQFSALSDAVADDDAELVKSIAKDITVLVNDRNKKCKLLK